MADNNSRELEVLAEIPRGKSDVLRVTLDEFADDRGATHRYISLRVWYATEDGRRMPSKKGCTIRKTEIMEVGKALRAALDAMNDTDGGNRFARSSRQPTAPASTRAADDARDWDGVF